ncbi:MAG TPA: class I SAM-dependent methyltransferase [Bryobacteraceae bacterium]
MPSTDLEQAVASAWAKASQVPGYIGEREFGALAMLFVSAPQNGVSVEIGSFKGKSTVGLAALAAHYGLGPIVSIDPHSAPSVTDPELGGEPSSFNDFLRALEQSGTHQNVEVHRAASRDVAPGWKRPIRFLWIDGDHTYDGAKSDFDMFLPYVIDGGIVALHDTLHEFEGPIRVFVEDMLRSDRFGPAGLLHSIGWAQYRPGEAIRFRDSRERLARRAQKLIPLVAGGRRVTGFAKYRWKLLCAMIPHPILPAAALENMLSAREQRRT